MIVSEILKTCSHEKVAQAAAVSIGGLFYERVSGAAHESGLPPGLFVARAVRDFDHSADATQKLAIERAVRKSDMPLLAGLQKIVEKSLDSRDA